LTPSDRLLTALADALTAATAAGDMHLVGEVSTAIKALLGKSTEGSR